MRWAYYNEHDAFAAAWLRRLIERGLIADGEVDERSIELVQPADLRGFAQHHFFAGIGGWSYALRLAGWEDSRPAWTASCPCQPFSAAGSRKAAGDERDLWPVLHRLAGEFRPVVVFGEQVDSPLGRLWLARVHVEMESLQYRVGAASLAACSVEAPHARQRLYWVSDADAPNSNETGDGIPEARAWEPIRGGFTDNSAPVYSLPYPEDAARRSGELRPEAGDGPEGRGRLALDCIAPIALSDAGGAGLPPCEREGLLGSGRREEGGTTPKFRPPLPWDEYAVRYGKGGRAYRIEPGLEPLADGVPGRVGRLRGYGNAIVPQVAAEFVRAYLEAREDA